ncbi:MAG: glycosyltransferase family 2 protein [Mangrovibacterium sp.]
MEKELSMVVCIYNEEQNILPLGRQIQKALEGIDYEVIYVDDGSNDRSREMIRSIADSRFVLVELKRNYGQSSALQAGIDQACGTYVALMDGDLQNDPADIPRMLKLCREEEWDMVAGVRANRKDGALLRKIPSRVANYLIRRLTGTTMLDLGCTLKVFTREAIRSIHIYGELHRFIPVLLAFEGSVRLTQIEVNHRAREFGKSKYNLGRTTRVISDLILMVFFGKYMQRPMHFFGKLGIVTAGIGAVIFLYLLGLKIAGQNIWGKPIMILGLILILMGIQFLTIGILTEIQMRTYYESQRKPTYNIRRISRNRQQEA